MSAFGGLSAGWGESEFEAQDRWGDETTAGVHPHVEFDAEMFGLYERRRAKRIHAYRRHDGVWRIAYKNKGSRESFSFLHDVKGHKFLLDLAGDGHTVIIITKQQKVLITVSESVSLAMLKQMAAWGLR